MNDLALHELYRIVGLPLQLMFYLVAIPCMPAAVWMLFIIADRLRK